MIAYRIGDCMNMITYGPVWLLDTSGKYKTWKVESYTDIHVIYNAFYKPIKSQTGHYLIKHCEAVKRRQPYPDNHQIDYIVLWGRGGVA